MVPGRSRVPLDHGIGYGYTRSMKLTLQLQLLPTPDQKANLLATMERFNEAATFAAKVGFEGGVFGQVMIHKRAYHQIRERFGISAQLAVRAIAKAVECFQRDKTKCPVFKPRSAICYDHRVLSFKGLTTVSMWSLSSRLLIPFVCRAYQKDRQGRSKGQADLIYRQGKFYLLCTIEMPENAPVEPTDVLGVDLGIVNLATDSSGEEFTGEKVDKVRQRNTSRTCPECGHCEKANRKNQAELECRHCGYSANTDFVGARNIPDRGIVKCPTVGVVEAKTGNGTAAETAYKP